MDGFELTFYQKRDGTVPMDEFIRSLEPKLQSKANRDLRLLQQKAPRIHEPYSKPMGDGLFELRIHQSNDIVRAFYFFAVGKRIVVTNGFIKKTRKTPREEIKRAFRYKKDWEERHLRG